MTASTTYSPLHKTVTVPWAPDAAFRRFTTEISRWWPFRTHSVGGSDVDRIVFDERAGGQIYELLKSGAKHTWGTVKEWAPPGRVSFTWHPGADPATYQDIEVTFTAVQGGTRLELVHTGWERLGALARKARRGYPIGWTYVLNYYAGRTNGPLVTLVNLMAWVIRLLPAFLQPKAPGAKSTAAG